MGKWRKSVVIPYFYEEHIQIGGYRITASIELTEVPQIEVEFMPQWAMLQLAPKARKSILQKIKEYFKGGSL